jgi:hypothetical protein
MIFIFILLLLVPQNCLNSIKEYGVFGVRDSMYDDG